MNLLTLKLWRWFFFQSQLLFLHPALNRFFFAKKTGFLNHRYIWLTFLSKIKNQYLAVETISSCGPDEWLQPEIARQRWVERFHHVDILNKSWVWPRNCFLPSLRNHKNGSSSTKHIFGAPGAGPSYSLAFSLYIIIYSYNITQHSSTCYKF